GRDGGKRRATNDRLPPPALGVKTNRRHPVRHLLAGIAAVQRPFTDLTLDFDDVEEVFLVGIVRRAEVRRLALDVEPAAGNGQVTAEGTELRIRAGNDQ